MSAIGDKFQKLDRLFSAAKSAVRRGKNVSGGAQPKGMQAQAQMGKKSFTQGHDAYINPKPRADADGRSAASSGRPPSQNNFAAEHTFVTTGTIAWDRKQSGAGNPLMRHNALRTPSSAVGTAPARRRAVSEPSLRPGRAQRPVSFASSTGPEFDASLLELDSPLDRLAKLAKAQGQNLAHNSRSSHREAPVASPPEASDVDDWAKFG